LSDLKVADADIVATQAKLQKDKADTEFDHYDELINGGLNIWEETARAAKEFKIYYQKQPLPGGGYTMDHSAGTFVLDKQGRLRLFAQYGAGAQALLHDIRLLIAE